MDITNIIKTVLSIGGLGLLFGLGLGYASKKFAVAVDERIPKVRDALPGANCGGCGFAGCDAFAKAVVEGQAEIDGCPVGGSETAKNVAGVLGIKAEEKEKQVAVVKCIGTCEKSKIKYDYEGITSCKDASFIPGGGSKSCSYGCLGLGSCERACQFDAVKIIDGIAIIDETKCVACGMCIVECPRNIIELEVVRKKVEVMCNSNAKGKDVKSVCEVGCIGCRLCTKVCPTGAITVENNLAKIDYEKCTSCGLCVEKCPTKVIKLNS